MQDPLVEFSQLCTTDDEILCLRYHGLQVSNVEQKHILLVITLNMRSNQKTIVTIIITLKSNDTYGICKAIGSG